MFKRAGTQQQGWKQKNLKNTKKKIPGRNAHHNTHTPTHKHTAYAYQQHTRTHTAYALPTTTHTAYAYQQHTQTHTHTQLLFFYAIMSPQSKKKKKKKQELIIIIIIKNSFTSFLIQKTRPNRMN